MRLTYPTALVFQALLDGRHHGFDIMDATGLPSGTVYPILRRLDAEGYVRSRWEKEGVARKEQRPARRYYELTAGGGTMAREAVARARGLAAAGTKLLRPVESEG
jgi:PadR family transcriptional regulator PadR